MNNKIILCNKNILFHLLKRKKEKKYVRLYFLGRVNLLRIQAELEYDEVLSMLKLTLYYE